MPELWESSPDKQPSKPVGVLPAIVIAAVLGFFAHQYLPALSRDWLHDWGRREQKIVNVEIEKGSWIAIVEETSDRAKFPWLASIITDRDYWDGLKSKGLNWALYDIDSPSVKSYREEAEKVGLPALFVISPAGKVRLAKSCPPTTQSIDELLGSIK